MDRGEDAYAERPVIIGGGIAGLMTALHLSPQPVAVLTRAPLGSMAASAWAQGGIAAALGADDRPELHAADTLAAGEGLCDPLTVNRIVGEAADAVADLARHGVRFDRGARGGFSLGLEAAHSRRRIVHAGGDGTGREIMRALAEAVRRTPSIAILEGVEARRLIVEDGRVAGVLARAASRPLVLPSTRVVIATGGVGGLYRHTTNPLGAVGQGLALAARAGAVLADVEFVQFHPTALDVGCSPMPLVSEAVRGEGAVLIDDGGERLMAGYARRELEPRDVVARAVWRAIASGRRVFLDAREALGSRFAERFPGIAARCRAAGVDPAVMPIPVRPAAHYHMGGIAVDKAGRASIEGLWACGEVAATGLHGANRLASNSLLEAVVGAHWVADSVAGTSAGRAPPLGRQPDPAACADVDRVREVMSREVGVRRDGASLRAAVHALRPHAFGDGAVADAALVGLMIATAALVRTESRGAHCRTDFPRPLPQARRMSLRIGEGDIAWRWMPVTPGAAAASEGVTPKG
ncbi:MAG TPA: L-aspartate oxidase [Hyphomicrobiaceae bacterium]|jgi:L-aspartate oxidase